MVVGMPSYSRRALLRTVGLAATGLTAGCVGDGPSKHHINTTTSSPTATETATTETNSPTSEPTESTEETETNDASSLGCGPGPRPEYAWPLPERSATNGAYVSDGRVFTEQPPVDWSVEPTVPEGMDYGARFTRPIIADGQLYVVKELVYGPNQRAPERHFLEGRDGATGERRWSYELSARPTEPVVDGDRVLVGAARTLHAVDRHEGSKLWSRDLSSQIGFVVPTTDWTYIVLDESVEVIADDGTTEWSVSFDSGVTARPAADEDHLYVGTRDGTLHAIDPVGRTEAWQSSTLREGYENDDAPSVGHIVITDCGVFALTDGDIYAFDTAGKFVWHAGETYRALATDGDTLYGGTQQGHVRALSADDGGVRWERFYGVENPRYVDGVWEPPVVTDEALYAFAQHETVLALRPEDGTELWTAARRITNLTLAHGTLYGTIHKGGSLVAMRR